MPGPVACLASRVNSDSRPLRTLAAAVAIGLTVVIAALGTVLWVRSLLSVTVPSLAGIPYSLGPCRPVADNVGFTGDPLLLGADVGASAELGDGRIIWAYGDTFRRPDGVTLSAVRNSLVVEDDGCRAVVIPAGGQEAIPNREDGVGYWPMSLAVSVEGRATVVRVFAERVRGSESRFGFVNLGPAVATFVVPSDGAPRLRSVVDLGPDDPSRRNVGWGAAVTSGGDGYLYIYGTANPEEPLVFGWSVRVARARAADLDDPSAWDYWTGSGWDSDDSRAVEVISAVNGVSQTFSVVEHGDSWYAVSKRDGDLGTDLAVWSATAPWGPFSPPVTVGRIPNQEHPSLLRYMPLAHPEVPSESGTVAVSICRNSADPALLLAAPEVYRPYFVSIELPPRPSRRILTASD